LSAKQNLREEAAKWKRIADEADRARQDATALLAAVIGKFGGTLTLTRADAAPITKDFVVAKRIDPTSGSVTLKVVVTNQQPTPKT
jgi:hypothetical protein